MFVNDFQRHRDKVVRRKALVLWPFENNGLAGAFGAEAVVDFRENGRAAPLRHPNGLGLPVHVRKDGPFDHAELSNFLRIRLAAVVKGNGLGADPSLQPPSQVSVGTGTPRRGRGTPRRGRGTPRRPLGV